MTPRSDPERAAVQRTAWDSLWQILLTRQPCGDENGRYDDAPLAGGAVGEEVSGNVGADHPKAR